MKIKKELTEEQIKEKKAKKKKRKAINDAARAKNWNMSKMRI